MSVRPRARTCDDHQRVLQQVCRLARSPEDQDGDEGGRPGRRFQRSLAQGLGRSDFTGGPKVDIAVRTTGHLTAGRNPRSGVFCLNVHNYLWRVTSFSRHPWKSRCIEAEAEGKAVGPDPRR